MEKHPTLGRSSFPTGLKFGVAVRGTGAEIQKFRFLEVLSANP